MTTQQEIADHLCLSQGQVSRMLAELGLTVDSTLDVIRGAYLGKLRLAAAAFMSRTGDNLLRERWLSERIDRQLKELQLQERRSQLVEIGQLRSGLAAMFASHRSWLAARDVELAIRLVELYGIASPLPFITEHSEAALLQFARWDDQVAIEPGARATGPPARRMPDSAIDTLALVQAPVLPPLALEGEATKHVHPLQKGPAC